MTRLLPDEFPFSRKRKTTTRRKTAKATDEQKAGAAAATLSVADVTVAAPAVEAVATIESVLAEATPAIVAPDVSPTVSAAAPVAAPVAAAAAPVVTPVAAPVVAPVAPAATVVPAKVAAPVAAIPVRVAGHATSRASVTPAASAVDAAARAADARATDGYGGPERRRSPRQALRAKAIYRNDMNPAGAGPVQILNFSMGGVRLWSTKPMKAGERGNVKMEIGPVKWSGRVKVVTCESHDDDGFAVGCEFAANEMARRVA
jgi:hypothetical protein